MLNKRVAPEYLADTGATPITKREGPLSTLTLVIKPVSDACNLACDYCYNAESDVNRDPVQKTMSEEILETLTREFLAVDQQRTRFIWHGGEPLLAGLNFYRSAIQLQTRINRDLNAPRTIVNSIQTNGTLIDKEWISFGLEHGLKFGVSLDGPEWVHNKFRHHSNGSGSFSDAMRGAMLLQERGAELGIGAVVSSASLENPKEVFTFLLAHFSRFNLSPCITTARTSPEEEEFTITNKEYVQFFKAVFELWWEMDDPSIRVRPFHYYVQAALEKTPKLCEMSGKCANYLAIDADGKVYPCGRFTGVPELCFGSILESSFEEIQESKSYRRYARAAAKPSKDCLNCEWFFACHNGCTFRRYQGNGTFTERDPFCGATREILPFVAEKVNKTKEFIKTREQNA